MSQHSHQNPQEYVKSHQPFRYDPDEDGWKQDSRNEEKKLEEEETDGK